MAKKLSRGRQKIELKQIEKNEDRLITFSKRRAGMYKKATEISTLCGVETGLLVFSPSGRPYAYGIPSLEAVVARILPQMKCPPPSDMTTGSYLVKAPNKARVDEMNAFFDELSAELERLRKEGEGLVRMKREIQADCWWDVVIEDLKAHEVEQFISTMEELKTAAEKKIVELKMEGTSSSSPPSSSPLLARSPSSSSIGSSSSANASPHSTSSSSGGGLAFDQTAPSMLTSSYEVANLFTP